MSPSPTPSPTGWEDEARYYELLGECEGYCPKRFWLLLIYLEDDWQCASAQALLVEDDRLGAKQRYLLRQVIKFYSAALK